jgi:hypothetical protein
VLFTAAAAPASDPSAFILSIIALILSGLSAAAALIAVWQTRRWSPRPLVQIEASMVDGNNAGANPYLQVLIANRGNAAAIDVRAVVLSRSGIELEERETLGTIAIDHRMKRLFGLSRESVGPDGKPNGMYEDGPVDLADLYLKVTWRQAPKIEKERSLAFEVASA